MKKILLIVFLGFFLISCDDQPIHTYTLTYDIHYGDKVVRKTEDFKVRGNEKPRVNHYVLKYKESIYCGAKLNGSTIVETRESLEIVSVKLKN